MTRRPVLVWDRLARHGGGATPVSPARPPSMRAARGARVWLLVAMLGLLAARPAAAQTEIVEYYGHDALGSIRIVFTASGVATARADYEPFGEGVTIAGMPAGPLPAQQFTGQERDGLERQDYFGARYYRPRHGRFSQVDPVYAGLFDPQQWNRYAYARNNPLSFVDPDGRMAASTLPCGQTFWVSAENTWRINCPNDNPGSSGSGGGGGIPSGLYWFLRLGAWSWGTSGGVGGGIDEPRGGTTVGTGPTPTGPTPDSDPAPVPPEPQCGGPGQPPCPPICGGPGQAPCPHGNAGPVVTVGGNANGTLGLGVSRSQGDVHSASDLLKLRFTPMSVYNSSGRGSGFPLLTGGVGWEIGLFRSANDVYGRSSQVNLSVFNVELSLFVLPGNQIIGGSFTINRWSTPWPSLSFWLVDTR